MKIRQRPEGHPNSPAIAPRSCPKLRCRQSRVNFIKLLIYIIFSEIGGVLRVRGKIFLASTEAGNVPALAVSSLVFRLRHRRRPGRHEVGDAMVDPVGTTQHE